jgi:hypothetical protein
VAKADPLSSAFKDELAGTDELLATVQRRLVSLKDYAEHERLSPEVVRRLENKNRAIGVTRDDLRRIPELVEQTGARR